MMLRYAVLSLMSLSLVILPGCTKPGEDETDSTTSTDSVHYDPHQDPLVNPAVVFEKAPKDLSKIDLEASITVHLDGNPSTLNPLFQSSQYEQTICDLLYEDLFSFDKDMAWHINPNKVDSFEESEDHRTFIVKMKQGNTWHDGHPYTAHDIVYSWQQIMDDQVPCPAVKPGPDQITECKALDDYTVQFVQNKPLATRRWNIYFPIVPKHLFEKEKAAHPDLKTGDYYNQLARAPIGSGPYKLTDWVDNDKIVLERWDGYQGQRPAIKRIVFKIIPDRNMALMSFKKGNLDVMRQLTAQQFAFETQSDDFSKVGYKVLGEQWSYSYIGYNMDGSNPFFGDLRVRQAMTSALNLPKILDKVYYNLAPQSYGIYHPAAWMANPNIKLYPYDLKLAAALLDEAGWKVSEEDGWRYKVIDGKPVQFSFTLTYSQGSTAAAKICAIFQEDLKRIGVKMDTRIMEWATFMTSVRHHEFQAATAAWGTGTDPDTGWNLWHSSEYETGRNYGGFSNPRVDELFEAGRSSFDLEKRKACYQEIHKIIYEEAPYTFINNYPILGAVSHRVRGLQFSPRGIYNYFPGMLDWWVPKTAEE